VSIKFGVQASQAQVSWDEYLSLCRWLDRDTNFDSLWLADHFVTGFGSSFGSEGAYLEGWSTLAAVAQATSRLRLGILVSGNTYRHPAVLAKMATTVDHISGGRLEFGIGGAWHEYEHQAFGIPFHTVRERLDRLDEAVQVIKLLWTQDRPVFNGRYYQLDRPPYNPPNVQQPHPPIVIGGTGEKRTLRTVAKYADVANVSFENAIPEEVRHKFDILDQHCRDVGRDPSTIRRTVQKVMFLTEDTAVHQRILLGFTAVRGISEAEARRCIILGSVAEAKAQVQALIDVGVQEIYVTQFPPADREALERFSNEVIPAFR
jgi:F420-dependent oxidoreductase-like protein